MKQLIYISSAARSLQRNDIDTILLASRTNNSKAGVSGLLLFNGRRFLQALEGPSMAVDATLHRIRDDRRHRAIVVLSDRTVTVREFGDWAMASYGPLGGNQPAAIDAVDRLVASVPDPTARETFRSFVRLENAISQG